LLLTSDQHYGAVINADFNYPAFLDKLASAHANFTRIYPGAYIEPENVYHQGNVLGPPPGRVILPWNRTHVSGGHPALGGVQYDLDSWNGAYFERLGDFCAKAQERDIIIEICFFNGMYDDRWDIQAMYHANNVQGIGTCSWDLVQSLSDPALAAYQENYVAEITKRLNAFDNIIFHLADEPWMGRQPASVFGPWLHRMIDACYKAEMDLPKKHLIGQTVDWRMRDNQADFSDDPRIQFIDIEYARGRDDLEKEYSHNKPVVYIETVFAPHEYYGDRIAATRVEAWEFMLGGCAGFMQLSALYRCGCEAGQDTEVDDYLDVFEKLRAFLESFNWPAMKRDSSFISGGIPKGAFTSSMSLPGEEYVFYIHHSVYRDPPPEPGDPGSFRHAYVVTPGSYKETFTFNLPQDRYIAEWIEPAAGSVIKKEKLDHNGGTCSLSAPDYSVDIALRIKKSDTAES
jgi:hypothetical protein